MNHRLQAICTLILFGVCLLFAITPVRKTANNNSARTAGKDSRVHLLHADKLYFDERLHQTAQFLVGNVRFSHEGTLMYCDSALFYQKQKGLILRSDAEGTEVSFTIPIRTREEIDHDESFSRG